MTAFWITAILLSAGALLFILPPLLRRNASAQATDAADENIAIYQQQFAELEADLANGVLDADQYEQSRRELERRVLQDASVKQSALRPARANWPLAITLATALPAGAAALYLQLGQPQAFVLPYPQMVQAAPETPPAPAGEATEPPAGTVAELLPPMTERLVERLTKAPDDGNGWALLGRSYIVMQRFGDASKAFEKAVALLPADASLLADYAGTLAMSTETRMQGKPTRLIEQALKLDPNSEKALYLAGTAAFDQKNFGGAVKHWEKMLGLMPSDSGRKRLIIQANVAEAKALLRGEVPPVPPIVQAPAAPQNAGIKPVAGAAARLTGSVTLMPSLAAKASPSDTVFIYVRAAEGPPMPLAIITRQVKDLPVSFSMDDTMAMMPSMKLSSFPQVRVVARISKSGNAMPQSGDLQGMSPVISHNTNDIKIVIEHVMP